MSNEKQKQIYGTYIFHNYFLSFKRCAYFCLFDRHDFYKYYELMQIEFVLKYLQLISYNYCIKLTVILNYLVYYRFTLFVYT